ncbi:16S rRNA (cytidine(1402)-2'-O)-methyltransferase [Cellulomonas bogoriensis]|uniref:Ribosomal RNA small subunit methyltransferase I n=1 Tax=Cellulomonas bogoriensis 69B4 = DSM 16987 TaxID=1386082 RepID=A0A0A0C172_9CELL|nr:16S rRNA (cytidine(1402)-2'-O)-methyltransferase [Cellulomonas bogoriensis]KGM13966.1 16S rRNA methyltransferase [Cellulomonas bogoriensis 69B4 = DSM 16987]
MSTGRIVLAATPIGDVEDASPRLRRLLQDADVVAAEDTRRLRGLLTRLGVQPSGRVVSHHEHNEQDRVGDLLEVARGGGTVLVVSDAGMPTVSDPGFALVRAAVDAGVPVTTAPGPSAVLAALAVSGLATDRFCFEGFLPRREGEREAALGGLVGEARTMVFFEAPHRVARTLATMARVLGPDRPAAVCRELTKTYEEVVRGPLQDLVRWAGDGEPRGEICVVVAGRPGPAQVQVQDVVGEVLARVDVGERLKDVVAEVAGATGVGKRDLYAAALAARGR